MKITAKEIETGMTVKDGYLTIKVDSIEKGKLKNGKITYTVIGNGTRRHTGTKIEQKIEALRMTFKAETKIKVL